MRPPPEHMEFAGPVIAVTRRMRLQSALDWALLGLALSLGGAALLLAAAKTGAMPVAQALTAVWWLLAPPLVGATLGGARRVDSLRAAHALDRVHGLKGLVASAIEFSRGTSAARSPFENATIERASARAPALSPAQAAPLHAPRASAGVGILAVGLGVLSLTEVPHRLAIAMPQPPGPQLLHEEDLSAERTAVEQVLRELKDDPALQELTGKLNELLEAMARRELSRSDALAKLEALERQLRDAAAADDKTLEEALKELAAPMRGHDVTHSLAEALDHADAQAAADALQALQKQLDDEALDHKQLDALRKRMLDASKPPPDTLDAQIDRGKKERDRLLRKQQQADLSPPEKRLLQKHKRELEKLERDQKAAQARKRTLEKLRRKLSEAGQALQQSRQGQGSNAQQGQEGSQRLSEAAQAARQIAQRQRSAGQRQRLQQRVGSLRELMRQQGNRADGQPEEGSEGKDGKRGQQGKPLDLARFGQSARGKQGQQGNQGQQGGKPGQQGGKPGQQGGKPGQQGGKQGPQGMLLQPGQGQPGQGDPMLIMPGGETETVVETQSAGGQAAGQGGSPEQGDRVTQMHAQHTDSSIAGQHGKGPTRSEVILEAASRGFASRDYEQVHENYRKHAESDLDRDRVPGGYRFYVDRYFQLIRGREGSDE